MAIVRATGFKTRGLKMNLLVVGQIKISHPRVQPTDSIEDSVRGQWLKQQLEKLEKEFQEEFPGFTIATDVRLPE